MPTIFRLALLVPAVVLPALGLGWLAAQHGANLPLHAGLEMAGAVVALMVAYALLRLDAMAEDSGFRRLQAAALAGMATLDGFHALMPAGPVFVWLHTVATVSGGAVLLLLWVESSLPPGLSLRLPGLALFAALLVGLVSLVAPASLPPMLAGGHFTATATWLNMVGGAALLLASLKLWLSYLRSANPADLVFSMQWLLLACGALLFLQSALWGWTWWTLHVLRLFGFCVSLWLVTAALRRMEARIVSQNNLLERKVADRTRELQQVVDSLKAVQQDLVQAEKMAALGALVAGISHELNTPVGTAVTLASTLEDHVAQFRQLLADGLLKKSTLSDFVERNGELAALILKCVSRAAELIASFKQVAIDQSSERRREFELRQLLDDVVATIRPSIKHAPVSIELEAEDGLLCDSYPGPLSQVVVNLIQNAVLHAFENRPGGTIRLQGRRHAGGALQLCVSDDGAGMAPNVLARIFDPFFTTRLGQGGSGIGLAVCHRIATSVLGGSLVAESAPGGGSRFTLTFPAIAAGMLQGSPSVRADLKEQYHVG